MLYVLMGQDAPMAATLAKRAALRPAHMARLEALQAQGRVILAGAMPNIDNPDPGPAGFAGSLIVAEFPSLDEAIAWWSADPFMTGGVYISQRVFPFRKSALAHQP